MVHLCELFALSVMELTVSECFTFGNIFLAIVFLLILNQLVELYQFRNMPPGPRLTSLPFVGNLLSFDDGDSLRDATRRFVCTKNHSMFICSIPDSDFVLTQRFTVSYSCQILALWDAKYGAPIAAHIARRWVLYKQNKFACYVASLRALLHDRKRLFI